MHNQDISRIIVRAPNWIGDAVMCTPALQDLREFYPHATITLWGRPAILELLHKHPSIDQVLSYEYQGTHAGILGKLRLIQLLRRSDFELAILLQNAFEAAFLTFLAGIPNRWGYGTDGRSMFLSKAVSLSVPKRGEHQVQYYQSLIHALTGKIHPRRLQLVVSPADELSVVARFPELITKPGGYLIGLNPGSVYGSSKRWLPDRFAELADSVITKIRERVDSHSQVQCVVVGGAGEESLAHAIASLMRCKPVILTGRTTLRELMGIVQRCSLFLTNDTGPMHIAAALNVPMVAIFGSTDPHHTAPYGSEGTVVHHPVACAPCFLRSCPIDHRCMTQVTVQEAYDLAMQQFERKMNDGSCS